MKDLVFKLDQEADRLIGSLDAYPVARTLFAGTITAPRYADYLEQTQHYVAVAHELLRASGERLLATRRHPLLARLLIEKSGEETGHDAWARDDRAAIGFGAADTGPNVAVQAYVFGHRFEAKMGSDVAFLGTAYILEALSVRRASSTAQNLLARAHTGDLTGLRLPRTLSPFAYLAAHYMGRPIRERGYTVCSLPLVVDLADVVHTRAFRHAVGRT